MDIYNREKTQKTYMGCEELTQLRDFDMSITPSIEVYKQMAVAWLIVRACGVRPDTIGTSYLRIRT